MWSAETAALIMAGGSSSRMRRGGSATHKGLRTVLGMPLIAWNLASLVFFGFREIYVAYNAREADLALWTETAGGAMARTAGARLQPLIEQKALGTIGAVACLPAEVTRAVVVNVDNLSDLPLDRFFRHHLASQAAATLAVHEHSLRIPFGRLTLVGDEVRQYQEKPEIVFPVCSGTSVWERRAMAQVNRGTAAGLPDMVERLIASGEKVSAFQHRSRWIDVNDEEALRAAEALVRGAGENWPGRDLLGLAHA